MRRAAARVRATTEDRTVAEQQAALAYMRERENTATALGEAVVRLCMVVETRTAIRYDNAAAAARRALADAQRLGVLP